MSDFNIAAKSKDEQGKVNVDLAASGVAYQEWLGRFVQLDDITSMQPVHLQRFFKERLSFYRAQLPKKNVWQSGVPPKATSVLACVNRAAEVAVYKTEGWFYLGDSKYRKAEVDPQHWMEIPPFPTR